MCYSEELKKDLNAYQTEDGWVMVGYKTVLQCEDHPNELRAVYNGPKGPRDPYGWNYMFGERESVHYHWEFGKPLEDEHGFHLGASKRSALKALLKMVYPCHAQGGFFSIDPDPHFPKGGPATKAAHIRHTSKYKVIRCIVPEWAIQENHATVMMAFKPGEKETWEDVKRIAAYHKEQLVAKELAMLRARVAYLGLEVVTEKQLLKDLGIRKEIIIPEKAKIIMPPKKLEKVLQPYTVADLVAVNSSYKTVPWAKKAKV